MIPVPEGENMKSAACPRRAAASLTELWSSCVIATVDDSYVKVARVLVLLVEDESTLHTGSTVTDRTRSVADQPRAIS
jgi:hypothetical protein